MTKILIIAGDVLPLPGYPTTGAGLRAWGLGQGLTCHGFDVYYSMPECHVKSNTPGEEKELSWHPGDREKPIRMINPDVVVICHWPAMPEKRLAIPTVLDLHGPHLIERCFWDKTQTHNGIYQKVKAFRKADFFTCAGTRQRYYFFNWLLFAGFPLDSEIISVIPVSMAPDVPQREFDVSQPDELAIVYGGMFLPWQNPVESLETLLEAMDEVDKGKLYLYGGPHPIVKDKSGKFERLMDSLSQNPRVRIMPKTPHDVLLKRYLKAHIAFDLMASNMERELAYTTRTVEYLWCGLPVIYNDYSELSTLIKIYNAGWTLDPDDKVSLRKKLCEILDNNKAIVENGKNSQQLIKENLTWDKTITPLIEYCRNPSRIEPGDMVFQEEFIRQDRSMSQIIRRLFRI